MAKKGKKSRESVSIVERFYVLRRDNHTCQYCGAKAPDAQLQIDHMVPVALGGGNDPSNLITACARCNLGKSSWDGKTSDVRARTTDERKLAAEVNFAERRESWSWWAAFAAGLDPAFRAVLHAICREADAAAQVTTSVIWIRQATCLDDEAVFRAIRGLEAVGMLQPLIDEGGVIFEEDGDYRVVGSLGIDFGFERGGDVKPPYALSDYMGEGFSPVERIYG